MKLKIKSRCFLYRVKIKRKKNKLSARDDVIRFKVIFCCFNDDDDDEIYLYSIVWDTKDEDNPKV